MLRKVLYWVLLPIEWIATAVVGYFRFLGYFILASNPLTIAIYMMRHAADHKRQETPP